MQEAKPALQSIPIPGVLASATVHAAALVGASESTETGQIGQIFAVKASSLSGPEAPYLEYGLNLPKVPEFGPDTPRKCDPDIHYMTCACTVHSMTSGCKSRDCDDCRSEVSRQRAGRFKMRFQHTGHRFLRITTFTVPAEARSELTTPEALSVLRRSAAAMLKRLGATWLCESTHPEGDKAPGVFKPHFNFLWVTGPDKWGTVRGPLLDKLKADWGALFGRDLGVIWHEYVDMRDPDAAKILNHRLRYFLRSFPGWGNKLNLRTIWYGSPPKKKDIEKKCLPSVCGKCGGELRYLCSDTLESHKQWAVGGRLMGLPPPRVRDYANRI